MKAEIYDGRKNIWQWDVDCRMILYGVELDEEIHFAFSGDLSALVVLPYTDGENIVCNIPNALLQKSGTLNLYICHNDSTVEHETIYIIERPKPDDYVYTETETLNYRDLDERITKLEQGGIVLPTVTEDDNGKVLSVVDGVWQATDLSTYSGEYSITPSVDAQIIKTAQKLMTDDMTINSIPYYNVGNTSGGSTVYIGSEIE